MAASVNQQRPVAPGLAGADPVRVLICDDSALIRTILRRHLSGHPGIAVAAAVANGMEAVKAVRQQQVDVVILDIEMPVMDGMTALPLLVAADPALRVLMSSALTQQGAAVALEALRLGASDYVAKPTAEGGGSAEGGFVAELIAKVLGLGRQAQIARGVPRGLAAPCSGPAATPIPMRPAARQRPAVLAIGSSTGGPLALLSLFQALGKSIEVPILLTQHMPPAFIAQLASQIERVGGPSCAEATDGERLRNGHVHLAPGNVHMEVAGSPGDAAIALAHTAPENFVRPAVDPMLRSTAAVFGGRVLAVILTGMGQDGLLGARCVTDRGGTVIAQDQASSIVWGMPGAVARAGLCHAVLPLADIAPKLVQLFKEARL